MLPALALDDPKKGAKSCLQPVSFVGPRMPVRVEEVNVCGHVITAFNGSAPGQTRKY
jgi:hypothetical protein